MTSDNERKQVELTICCRIYPGINRRPFFSANDKLSIVKTCMKSLKQGLEGISYRLIVLLDNCPDEYETFLKELFDPSIEIQRLGGVGNQATFFKQIEILKSQQSSEIVFFYEDDYLFVPGKIAEIVHFMQSNPLVDFLTPYDSSDYHKVEFHKTSSRPHDGPYQKVKTTTCTFFTRKSVLQSKEVDEALKLYPELNDIGFWLILTKLKWSELFNFFSLSKVTGTPWVYKYLFGKLLKHLPSVLRGRPKNLLVSRPTAATHIEEDFLAPGIDWQKHLKELQ